MRNARPSIPALLYALALGVLTGIVIGYWFSPDPEMRGEA